MEQEVNIKTKAPVYGADSEPIVRTAAEMTDANNTLSIMGNGEYSNPTVGDAAQGQRGFLPIQQGSLDVKTSAGMVGSTTFTSGTLNMNSGVGFNTQQNQGDTLNTSYDNTDRSAKWQRPHPQDIPPMGANQYQ